MEGGAHLVGQTGGGRLLDHLLVSTLHRAVTIAEDDDVPAGAADDLHLDVAGTRDVRLDEDGAVAERRLGLGSRRGDLVGQPVEVVDDPHATATSTGGRLDDQRQVAGSRGSATSSTGTPAARISSLARTLDPIASIDSGVGPTQVRPAARTDRAKSAFSDRKP